MAKGWISIHRKIQECEIWVNNEPFDIRSAWIDLLLLANHEDVEMVFDYEPVIIKRGQFLTSVRKLGARWSWSKNRVLKYLRLLESLNMIERESNNQRTLLTIVKYDVYQRGKDTDVDTGIDTGMNAVVDAVVDTGMPQTIMNNNENNENNENKNTIPRERKHKYGEYENVLLTDTERDKLMNEFGELETSEAIKFLDEYIEMKGYKAKSHYLAIRKWVFDAIKRDRQPNNRPSGQRDLIQELMNV
jgi:hypothetical protein